MEQKSVEEAKFSVGDEVQFVIDDGRIMKPRFVVTSISYDGTLNGIGLNGIAFCDKNPDRWHKTGRHYVEAELLMKALEAVPVIRCKDCKYRDNDFCTGRGYPNSLVPDNGFCDKGERRE